MNISHNVKPVIWGMAGGAIATMIVGFSWGGWITQGTAGQMETASATAAVVKVFTPLCVSRAEQQTEKLAGLREASSWKHRDFRDRHDQIETLITALVAEGIDCWWDQRLKPFAIG